MAECRGRGCAPLHPGVRVGQSIRPLESVGCYVPGGRYPLPSTVLMTVIPAQVAGVKRIAVASPRPAPETLAAARMIGVTEFYRIGGAQAIAAFAYGTQSMPRVDKIVGPGNSYVTAAKMLVRRLRHRYSCRSDRDRRRHETATRRNRSRPGGAGRARSGDAGHLYHQPMHRWPRRYKPKLRRNQRKTPSRNCRWHRRGIFS